MSENNPVLENVDDALDRIEAFVAAKFKGTPKTIADGLLVALRNFLKVPDNYGGDAD